MRIFDKAVDFYGTSHFGRWLLPDGQFLNFQGDIDHRNISHCANDNRDNNGWLEFIEAGACTIHYDGKAQYLWIRTTGLTSQQRTAFTELLESGYIKVSELYVQEYEGKRQINDFSISEDSGMCKLYLTDTIAYLMELSEMESLEE